MQTCTLFFVQHNKKHMAEWSLPVPSGWSLPFVELLFNPDRRLIHLKQSTKWKRGLMRPWHTATANSFHNESTSSEWKSREALLFIFPFFFADAFSLTSLRFSWGGRKTEKKKKKQSCSCLRWFHHKPGVSFHNPCLGEFKGLFLKARLTQPANSGCGLVQVCLCPGALARAERWY